MIAIPAAVDVAALKDTTLLNMGIFGLFVAVTMVIVFRASRNNKTAADYYAAGPVVHRLAEWHRHRRRLPVRGILPGHHRSHRHQRL